MSSRSIKIEIPTTVTLHVKQAMIVPFTKFCPIRKEFSSKATTNAAPSREMHRSLRGFPNIEDLLKWSQNASNIVYELHVPAPTPSALKNSTEMLADPKFQTALYFIGGMRFSKITGHPDGTEIWCIDDVMYRTITWRSITASFWNKRNRDAKIAIREDPDDESRINERIFFLHKCTNINEEPLKSIIIDAISGHILEKDKPKSYNECLPY